MYRTKSKTAKRQCPLRTRKREREREMEESARFFHDRKVLLSLVVAATLLLVPKQEIIEWNWENGQVVSELQIHTETRTDTVSKCFIVNVDMITKESSVRSSHRSQTLISVL